MCEVLSFSSNNSQVQSSSAWSKVDTVIEREGKVRFPLKERSGICPHHFCSLIIGQNLATWPHLAQVNWQIPSLFFHVPSSKFHQPCKESREETLLGGKFPVFATDKLTWNQHSSVLPTQIWQVVVLSFYSTQQIHGETHFCIAFFLTQEHTYHSNH